MNSPQPFDQNLSLAVPVTPEKSAPAAPEEVQKTWIKKLRSGLLVVIGFLLSPLSWWNDLFFNLPIAYCFGYACSLISPNLLMPCTIVGYWFSCVAGILLMQAGLMDVVQDKSKPHNFKKELLTGIASATVYTFFIVALLQLKILNTPALFPVS